MAVEAAAEYDRRTRQVLEWQYEQVVRAIPGVESASVSVKMRQPGDWPMPLGAPAVERVDVRVVPGGDRRVGGAIRGIDPVRPVDALGPQSPDQQGAGELGPRGKAGGDVGGEAGGEAIAGAVKAVLRERFGVEEDAVHVEIGG